MLDDFFTNPIERYRIQVLVVAHLDAAQVKAHHTRVVANKVIGVGTALLPLPSDAIERVVLMAVHDAAFLQLGEALNQLLRRGFLNFGCTGSCL